MINTVSESTCLARFGSVKEDINEIKSDIILIKNNHLAHIQTDMALVKSYIQDQKAWTKWIVPLVLSVIFTTVQILISKGFI